MWIFYALGAAILWGLSYTAMGRLLSRGMDQAALYFLHLVLALIPVCVLMVASGRFSRLGAEIRSMGMDAAWIPVASLSAASAWGLIMVAIGQKNSPVATLVEISYPLATAFFCWLFFRDSHMNSQTFVGAALIFAGIVVIAIANKS